MGKGISEKEFTVQFLDLAKLCGWFRVHFRAARTKHGWETPIQGDGKGFLDTILVKDRVLWIELKVRPNKLTREQVEWMERLLRAKQEVYCFYPEDWEQIKAVLGYRGA